MGGTVLPAAALAGGSFAVCGPFRGLAGAAPVRARAALSTIVNHSAENFKLFTEISRERVNDLIILGIDPGIATLGYGVLRKDEHGNVACEDYGVVTTPKEENLAVRLAMLEEGLGALLDKARPDEVAVEELFFTKNVTTGIAVAHARGVALLTCVKRCGRLFEYTPMQIKQALTGYGKAEKRQIQLVTANLLRLKGVPRPDDAADALAVALCHSFTSRLSGLYKI